MIKKIIILCICALLCLTGCNYDKYTDKRPTDFGDTLWLCSTEKYNVWFSVNTEEEEYYTPKGEITIDGNTYFCKFYFIHQTNQLHISVYSLEYRDASDDKLYDSNALFQIKGECDFSSDSFTFNIDKSNDTLFDSSVKSLVFLRIES